MASTCLQSPSAFKQDALPVILSSNASEDKLRDTLSSIIDFNSIAERSLEKQWKQVEESKREDFKQTLQTLMVNNYVARFKGNAKDQNFEWVFVDSKTFKVITTSTNQDTETEIEFIVSKTSTQCWKISDIVIDEVSVVENYKEQFSVVVKKHGFDSLLDRMKAKANV
tara:strand:+ start:1330 stop:1833 length:504 start_codon:yes stop_codon:yes gene_type:complete